jgi:hypothetical protein
MDIATLSKKSRNLWALLEPIAGQVYFSPECHANYQALGFAGSRGVQDGVAMPDRSAYFTSRGSVMGQVSGQVVTATFAVFNPEVVIPAVEQGWALTDAASICDARDRGAIAQLERILGTTPEGIDRVNEILLRSLLDSKVCKCPQPQSVSCGAWPMRYVNTAVTATLLRGSHMGSMLWSCAYSPMHFLDYHFAPTAQREDGAIPISTRQQSG